MTDEELKTIVDALTDKKNKERGTVFERHAQTVLVGLITLIIAWVGISIQHLVKDAAQASSDRSLMKYQIEQLTHSWKQASENHVSYNEFTEWKASVELRFQEFSREEKIHLQKHLD